MLEDLETYEEAVVDERTGDDESFGPTLDSMIVRRTAGLSTELIIEKILVLADALAGDRLYPYQRSFAHRVCESILERLQEEITALFSRQSGKSQTLSALVGACMIILPMLSQQFPEDDRFRYHDPKSGAIRSYGEGFWVGIFAPKKSQAGIIFNRIRRFFRRATSTAVLLEAGLTFETNNGDTLRLSNGSFILCSTASDQSNIEGTTLHLGIMDESQDISDEKATKSIGPMLAATGGTIVKIGTANAKKSHFYNSIRINERRELQGGAKNHFFADWTVAASYNTLYDRFVRREMIRLGERSDEFRMAYCCQFMLQRGLAMVEPLFNNRCVRTGPFSIPLVAPRRGIHYVAGIDFGKVHDSTVVTLIEVDWDNPRHVLTGFNPEEGEINLEIYGKHVCGWMELLGDDYEAQFVEIRRYLDLWRPERIALDYTGVGIALGDRVRTHFPYADTVFVPYSSQMKDQLGRQFLSDITAGYITWPGGIDCQDMMEWKQFRLQMLDLEKEYKNGGLLDLHHPEVRGAHDDYPQSLMLGIHAALEKPFGGEVEETDENIFS